MQSIPALSRPPRGESTRRRAVVGRAAADAACCRLPPRDIRPVRWQIGRLSFAECVCAKKLRDMGAVEERESREGGAWGRACGSEGGASPRRVGAQDDPAGSAFKRISLLYPHLSARRTLNAEPAGVVGAPPPT